ncbi:hypothetical protein AB0E08_49580, partial [Streptomyces sp. NPDC048281]|uniref:hypothetical protein n=1 Tax=Streptomyces sp. NPDC048281 TaxID=3154715 RepID=UPI00344448A4
LRAKSTPSTRSCESPREMNGQKPVRETRGPSKCADQLYWFRWMIGHQTTFIFWQLLERTFVQAIATDSPAAREEKYRHAANLVRGYSAMLLYCGSCTREDYHRLIRPSMARHHPGFSGAWARDYRGIRSLLRGSAAARQTAADADLARACSLNNQIHQGIAQKLVPDAPSLLQETIGNGGPLNRGMLHYVFDTFFMTLRASLPPGAVLLQMLRRFRAIRLDVDTNGLNPPFASSDYECPDFLTSPEIIEIADTIPDLLDSIAQYEMAMM